MIIDVIRRPKDWIVDGSSLCHVEDDPPLKLLELVQLIMLPGVSRPLLRRDRIPLSCVTNGSRRPLRRALRHRSCVPAVTGHRLSVGSDSTLARPLAWNVLDVKPFGPV